MWKNKNPWQRKWILPVLIGEIVHLIIRFPWHLLLTMSFNFLGNSGGMIGFLDYPYNGPIQHTRARSMSPNDNGWWVTSFSKRCSCLALSMPIARAGSKDFLLIVLHDTRWVITRFVLVWSWGRNYYSLNFFAWNKKKKGFHNWHFMQIIR